MALKIFKYAIDVGTQRVVMPRPLDIRHIAFMDYKGNPQICMWIEVDTETRENPITVHLIATGETVPKNCRFGGTVVTPGFFVWHLFIPEKEFGIRH